MLISILRAGVKRMEPVVPSDGMWVNGHKLKHKFHLNMRKNFTLKVTEPWNRLPRENVVSCSSDIQNLPG